MTGGPVAATHGRWRAYPPRLAMPGGITTSHPVQRWLVRREIGAWR